jgi:hypothetical protein
MPTRRYDKNHPEFNNVLDKLEKRYYNTAGDPEAEIIVNWNKREVKEDNVVSFYAENSAVRNAIVRCRKGLEAVEILGEGVNLYFKAEAVRPLHTVLKIMN